MLKETLYAINERIKNPALGTFLVLLLFFNKEDVLPGVRLLISSDNLKNSIEAVSLIKFNNIKDPAFFTFIYLATTFMFAFLGAFFKQVLEIMTIWMQKTLSDKFHNQITARMNKEIRNRELAEAGIRSIKSQIDSLIKSRDAIKQGGNYTTSLGNNIERTSNAIKEAIDKYESNKIDTVD